MKYAAALGALALCLLILLAPNLERPGFYIRGNDGAYYPAVARSLAQGRGFTVDFVWLFAGRKVQPLPTPVLPFKQPLASLLMVPGVLLFGDQPLVYLLPNMAAGLLAVLIAYGITRRFGGGRRLGMLAGLLALLSNDFIHVVNFAGPDPLATVFVMLMVLAMWRGMASPSGKGWYLLAAFWAGLAGVTRNYGLLALAAPLVAVLSDRGRSWRDRVLTSALMILVCGLVVLPWEVRNVLVWGPAFSKGSLLFAEDIRDIFSYRSDFTMQRYLAQGGGRIAFIYARSFFERVSYVLTFYTWPVWFAALGGLVGRLGDRQLHPLLAYWCFDCVVTGLLIPSTSFGLYLAPRYLLPCVVALAACGVGDLGTRLRAAAPRAGGLILAALIAVVIMHAGGTVYKQHDQYRGFRWDHIRFNAELARWFRSRGLGDETVMMYDASTLNWETGMKAVLMPSDNSIDTILQCARDYGIHYLVSCTGEWALRPVHSGRVDDPRLQEVYSFANPSFNLGDTVKIYRIRDVPAWTAPN